MTDSQHMPELAQEGGEPIREEMLPLATPVLGDEEVERVAETLQSGWVTTGDRTAAFEDRIATRADVERAVGTTNCSSALYLAYRCLDLSGEVITTPNTFATTVSGIRMAGATPVLADIREDTLTLDPESVKEAITDDTEAIVPVHYAGQAIDMDPLLEIAADYDLALVEDAAHGLGGAYEGRPLGSLGDIGCYSFHPTKAITTAEGGALLTDDTNLAERAEYLRLAGVDKDAKERASEDNPHWHYDVTEVSGKFNMNDVQAAIGLGQFERLDGFLEQRRSIGSALDEGLDSLSGVQSLSVRDPDEHARHLYPIVLDESKLGVSRRDFETALNAEGIDTGVYYIPIYDHSAFSDIDTSHLESATDVIDRTLCVPIHPGMERSDAEDVVNAVEKVISVLGS